MTQQEEHKKRLVRHIQESISTKLDDLFVEPNVEYAEDIKQSIYEKAMKFLEESFPDYTINISQVNPVYYPNDETLAIDIHFQMNKPIESVEIKMTKPEGMSDCDFERFINVLLEELENIEHGTSDKILQND